jgi:hypothetical protein
VFVAIINVVLLLLILCKGSQFSAQSIFRLLQNSLYLFHFTTKERKYMVSSREMPNFANKKDENEQTDCNDDNGSAACDDSGGQGENAAAVSRRHGAAAGR